MSILAHSFFQTANLIEAGLWGLMAISFLVSALMPRTSNRTTAFIAAVTFLAFGLSDVVETRTAAWWRPWWLLAWKGTCVAIFLVLLIHHVVEKRRKRGTGFQPVRTS